jgi:hypothetical protein
MIFGWECKPFVCAAASASNFYLFFCVFTFSIKKPFMDAKTCTKLYALKKLTTIKQIPKLIIDFEIFGLEVYMN